jgi:hypothetical protein
VVKVLIAVVPWQLWHKLYSFLEVPKILKNVFLNETFFFGAGNLEIF